MKKIILAVSALLFAVGLYFAFWSTSSAPVDIQKVVEQNILLYPESGDVTYRMSTDSQSFVATASPTIIPNNAIVHTGIGRASVLLPDNSSVTLIENTEITITYNPTKISMYQSFGTTYHRVEKLMTGSSYQVQTAGTLAAVRGTKFIVSYDNKQKKTKVAVTESKVEVTTITKAKTDEVHEEEVAMVETGRTVTVDTEHKVKTKDGKLTAIAERAISDDEEIVKIVEREKKGDDELEVIKKESKEKKLDKKEVRKEIKRVLFNDDESDDDGDEHEDDDTKREDDTTKKLDRETLDIKKEDNVVKEVTETQVVKKAVVAVDEEKFFTEFEALFIKYFYLDENDTTCAITTSPDDRVKIVHDFADKNGYPFTKDTLPSFAREIRDYCQKKDVRQKGVLQSRFDDEYPF